MTSMNFLNSCLDGLGATEVSKRKKSVKQLRDLLNDSGSIDLLNRYTDRNSELNWTYVFTSVHSLLLKDSVRIMNIETKDARKPATVSRCDMEKSELGGVISIVVNKANQQIPRIKCSTLVGSIVEVLSHKYLCKSFSPVYIEIARKNIFPFRSYWGALSEDNWNDLTEIVWKLFATAPPYIELAAVTDILESILKYGGCQSFIGLKFKNKFSLLAEKFLDPNFHTFSIGTQENLIKFATTICTELGKECRMAVCHLGELILLPVIQLHDNLSKQKELLFKFLLLQVKLHHPFGTTQAEDKIAFAANWEEWNPHLNSLFTLIKAELLRIQNGKQKEESLETNFLQLSVEVCKQVFHSSGNSSIQAVYEISLNESFVAPAAKKMKLVAGIQAVMSILQTLKTPHDAWPWLQVLSALIVKYPAVVNEADFIPLLQLIAELLGTCKDIVVMKYLFMCCISLLKVEQYLGDSIINANVVNVIWDRIWETTLRTVGLNQCEQYSHKLVQELIVHSKIQSAASDLLILYITGSIRQTEPALTTLQFLCNQYQFPHRINVSRGTPAVREALQTWLLPEDITTRPHLNTSIISQILVLLVLKTNTFSTQKISNSLMFTNEFEHVVYDVEKNYVLTAFENVPYSQFVSESQEFDFSIKFVTQPINYDSKSALLEVLDRDLTALQNQSTNSMTWEEKLKYLKDTIYQIEMLLHIWSWLIYLDITKPDTPPRFTDSLEVLLDTLSQVSASLVSYPVALNWFVDCSFQLFDTKFHPHVTSYLREIVPVNILQLLYNLSCKKQVIKKIEEDMEIVSDFSSETRNIINHHGLMDSAILDNQEAVKLKALKGLCCFCISPEPRKISGRHADYLEKVFNLFMSEDFIPSSKLHFQMAGYAIKRLSGASGLPHSYVKRSLRVIQILCKTWHLDHEAVGIILELLQGLFVHIHEIGQNVDKENAIVLLKGLQKMASKKKYGPKVLVKLLCCLGHIAKVDMRFSWTLWNLGTKLTFIESKDMTPISEEIVIYLGHPFHELRMTAINFVQSLFRGEKQSSDTQLLDYHTYLFENICKVVMASFVIEGELTEDEKIDECANRSSTALHSMASLIISSSFLRKRALFALIQLAHEKKISLGLTDKVLGVIGNVLGVKEIRSVLETNLNYLIIHWNQQKYKLQDFPWSLLKCSSETDFYDKYLATIVPILLRKEDDETLNDVASKVGKNLPQLIEMCYPRIMGCLLPCFSIDSEGVSYTAEVHIAKRLLRKLEQILSKDRLSQLLSKNLDTTIVSTFRLLFDQSKFIELSGCIKNLPEPDPPHFKVAQIVSSLEYLQKNSPEPGTNIFVFLSDNSPGTIQKVMLQFGIDLYTGPTLEDRLKSLHCYLLFANILGSQLQTGNLQKVAPYIIRDILYTLINLVKTTNMNEDELVGGVLHFLWLFCNQCIPAFSSIIGLFLSNIVSVLMPIITLNSNISFQANRLLKFLIVENSNNLASSIKQLSPFPVDTIYDDLQLIYKQIVNEGKENTLEVEISQFLEACRIINKCQVERLQHLCTQLSEKKDELCQLYIEQRKLRGFSEDCEKSILHNLIYVLIKQLSSKDRSIRIEVSRCLSELGPCDLTTLMIHPGSKEQLDLLNNTDMVLSLTGLVINLFNTCLLDKDIFVVEAASNALYVVMASKEAQFILDKMKSELPNIQFLTPFLPIKRNKKETVIEINKCLFEQLINRKDLWVPSNECTHALWITNLVCSILRTFVEGKSYLSHLIHICKLKVSVSEKILPFLIGLLINHEKECEVTIINNMNEFFLTHFQKHANLNKERSISPDISLSSKKEICLNQDSVQCMLNVVHFLREWNTQLLNFCKLEEKINFLHIAKAAQFCSAYFTSILYAELWCSNYMRSADVNINTSALEYIFDVDKEYASVLQNVLFEAYIKIGDSDAVYGCGPSKLFDSLTQVHHFELIGKWDRVIQSYDLDISSGIIDSTSGLLFALQRFGLNHILQGYLESRKNHESVIQTYETEYYYDCAWRLSNWDILLSSENQLCERKAYYSEKNLTARLYEKHHYMALKCLHEHDVTSLQEALCNARNCVIQYLSHTNLESSKIIYYSLAQLQALQEIEDFSEAYLKDNVSLTQVAHKWKQQDDIGYNDFEHIEPIFTQRVVMLGIARKKEKFADQAQSLYQKLNLEIANRAREEGHFQVAMKCLRAVTCESFLSHSSSLKLKVEEAKLSWVREDKDVALYILRSVINDPQLEKGELYALALTLYADWLVDTKSESPNTIIKQYFLKSVEIIENIIGTNTDFQHLIEAYWSLSNFCDSQYQQLNRYFKSSEFEIKEQYVNKTKTDIVRFQSQISQGSTLTNDERRALNICDRQAKIDSAEISSAKKEMDFYLITAMKYYLKGLEHSDRHDLKVFRFAHLWLENMVHIELCKVIEENLNKVPNHKFIPLLPQLTPRISNVNDFFSKTLCSLVEQCAIIHPHHTLSLILSIANAYKDQEFCESKISVKKLEPRVVGAQQLIQKLSKNREIGMLVQQMQKMSLALISLAYYKPKQDKGAEAIPHSEPLMKLKDLTMIPLQTISIPVNVNGCYDNIIGIAGYEPKFSLVGGVNFPKKITCYGTDGVKRPQLIKGKDDLRQDAVMQQVFTMMNTFLQKHKETSKRKLLMRTYKVIPLSKRSGIIEWCQNTEVLGLYLVGSDGKSGAHRKYYPNDLTGAECRSALKKVASESNEKKLEVFQRICKSFHPVLHNFFLENFLSAGVWFERRLAYIHSVATSSMIGYILGLGDRHVINILLDKNTAEIIHIDFGIAFEMGRILPTPETVPFRLTRDIVDAMGASGVEGVFRRSCEKTMLVLRQNKDIILTILEVLLYDPLYAWSLTPSRAYNMQHSGSAKRGTPHNDEEESSAEVNKMAERALLRLQQKLQGTEEGAATSISGQVNHLIQQARDPGNLSRLFVGWQAYL